MVVFGALDPPGPLAAATMVMWRVPLPCRCTLQGRWGRGGGRWGRGGAGAVRPPHRGAAQGTGAAGGCWVMQMAVGTGPAVGNWGSAAAFATMLGGRSGAVEHCAAPSLSPRPHIHVLNHGEAVPQPPGPRSSLAHAASLPPPPGSPSLSGSPFLHNGPGGQQQGGAGGLSRPRWQRPASSHGAPSGAPERRCRRQP